MIYKQSQTELKMSTGLAVSEEVPVQCDPMRVDQKQIAVLLANIWDNPITEIPSVQFKTELTRLDLRGVAPLKPVYTSEVHLNT